MYKINLLTLILSLTLTSFCSSKKEKSTPPSPVKLTTSSTIPTFEKEDTLGPKELKMEYFDLRTLPPSQSVSFYEFQEENNTGLGVLKQGYSFNLVSWMRTEDFGIRCVLMTSKAPEKYLNTVSEDDYVKFINAEIKKVVPALFKDKNVVNAIIDALKKPDHYTYYPKTKSYNLYAEHNDYDEITIAAEWLFLKDLHIAIVARGIDTSW